MSTAVATTTAPPFAPSKSQETCPAILPLLDRNALRLLAVWSPDVLTSAGLPPALIAVPSALSTESTPSTALPSLADVAQPPPVAPVSVPLPGPHPSPSDLWSSVHIDFSRLADLTGLADAPLKTAFRQVKAHRLIYPDGSLNTHVKDLLDARTHRLTAFAKRRRLLANRANALKSTGPRSTEGKAVTALNALKHALSAETPVLLGEKREHYDAYLQALRTEYDPQGTTETLLLDQLAHIAWRLRRVDLAEANLCARLHNIDHERVRREVLRPYQPRGPIMEPDANAGFILVRACEENLLSKIDRHHTALHRAFFRTLHELLDIQCARHNATDDKEIQHTGFVLKNENSPSAPIAVPSTPSTQSTLSMPSTASTPSTLSTLSIPPTPVPRLPSAVPLPSTLSTQSTLSTLSIPPTPVPRPPSAASGVAQPPPVAAVAVPEPRTPNPPPRPSPSNPPPLFV